MAYFKDDKMLYKCLGTLFDRVKSDDSIGPKLQKSGLTIRFIYREPEAEITIDTKAPPQDDSHYYTTYYGPCDLNPDVEMTMRADIGHLFWHGKVNLVNALTRRQIVAKGPIPKILKLLPVIQPTYKMYPEILREIGHESLILT